MSIEAMKQALKALEYPLITTHEAFDVDMAELLAHRAIDSLRKSIAEAEKQQIVQVTIKDFVNIVKGKENLIGKPRIWAQWPFEENT